MNDNSRRNVRRANMVEIAEWSRLYRAGFTTVEIAEIKRLPRSHIHYHLKRAGVRMRSNSDYRGRGIYGTPIREEDYLKLKDLVERRYSTSEMAIELGIKPGTVQKRMKMFGLSRTVAEANKIGYERGTREISGAAREAIERSLAAK